MKRREYSIYIMTTKPSIPKGTRDFLPEETARRNYIFDTIREVYELYGFRSIETPAMENLSTLMGKYGEEGDKLLFKILNSGNFLSDLQPGDINPSHLGHLASVLCEKGLRYDLTVPFARFVVQHREEIKLPFRRYQIQPVWRADRPQKGRYREFYQCDADVVGSDSLLNEVELVEIIDEVFSRLNINVDININNRKLLTAMAERIGAADKITEVTVAIDKLDKIGPEGVEEELRAAGIDEEGIAALRPVIGLQGSNDEKLAAMRSAFGDIPAGTKGLEETEFVLGALSSLGLRSRVTYNPALARGLNYYTGCIFEVKALDTQIGSITGGGRYDNLTGIFGMPGLSGVGISFGADRIYDVLTTLDLFPPETGRTTQLFFVNFGDEAATTRCLKLASAARKAGIRTEVFPDAVKMKKQMAYASALGVRYVAIIGGDELSAGTVTLKDMDRREQQTVGQADLVETVKAGL